MTVAVPTEAARRSREMLVRIGQLDGAGKDVGSSQTVADQLALIEFAEQFGRFEVPNSTLTVAGEMRELIFETTDLNAEELDLIRVNGRIFAPEVIEVVGEEALTESETRSLDDMISLAQTFRDDHYDDLWNLRNRLKPFVLGDEHFDAELEAESQNDDHEAAIAELKETVIAFAAPHAEAYARERGWPKGDLHPVHFDILEKAGARMVDFRRHEGEG